MTCGVHLKKNDSLKRKSALLFLLRILKIGINILIMSLSAKYFGISVDRDVWLLAFSSMVLLENAIWGPLNETFRSKFIFLKSELGEANALDKVRSLIFFMFVISLLLCISIALFPEPIAKMIAPSFKGDELKFLLIMIRLLAPYLLFNQLVQILTSILNSYDSFYIPEIAGLISNIINLVLIYFLAQSIGIYALLLAYYISIAILFILIGYQISKLNLGLINFKKAIFFDDFKLFFLFALPFFLPYFFGQLSGFIEKNILSSLGLGFVSLLDYSKKFNEVIISVLFSVLATILVPVLSTKYAEKKPSEFVANFLGVYQLGFLFLTLFIALFTSSSESFVRLLYDNGGINPSQIIQISELTIYYSWATLAVFIYAIFGMSLLSSGASKKYALLGLIAQILGLITNVSLVKSMGIYIFPLSYFIAHFTIGLWMMYLYPFKSSKIYWISLKYLVILLLTVLISYCSRYFLLIFENPFIDISIHLLLILGVLTLFSFIFKLEERLSILKFVSKITKR